MPFLSRSIDQIGKDADETSPHRDENLTVSFNLQASPKIPKIGILVERLSSFYAKRGKHLFDAIAAFLLIIIFAPLMGLVAVLIKLTSRGSVFFSHKRVGLNSELFIMYKFRSLHVDTPSYSEKPDSTDDERITPVGKWLRKTSLDELPQLFNVIKGEMESRRPASGDAFPR